MPARTKPGEKLGTAKKPGESFSQVVRRASLLEAPLTGEALLAYLRSGGAGVSESYLDNVEKAISHDSPPDDPWV